MGERESLVPIGPWAGTRRRENALDGLRALVIALVIVLHLALAYLRNPFPGWVHDSQKGSLVAGLVVLVLDGPFLMSVMFFLAGYFARSSLARRGQRAFLREKFLRLGIPWAIGTFACSPLLAYISLVSDGLPVPKGIQFITSFAWNPSFSQYHFWYLEVLLWFFVGYAIIGRPLERLWKTTTVSPLLWIGGFILFTAVTCAGMNSCVGFFHWLIRPWAQFQTTRILEYVAYFALGLNAASRGWLTTGYTPRVLPWLFVYLLSLTAYLVSVVGLDFSPIGIIELLAIHLPLATATYAFLMVLLALAQRFLGSPNRFSHWIARRSYAAYLVHLHFTFIVQWVMQTWETPAPLKLALQVGLTLPLAWIGGAALLQIPFAKRLV